MIRKTTLALVWALPLLAAAAASPLAQTPSSSTRSGAPSGPGTAEGAATSRSQIGAPSPAGVVNPNATGTGLGTSVPGSVETFQNLNQDGANSTAGVGQQNVRCPQRSGSVAAASSSVSGDPAGALARATGSRAAGQTPTTDVTGSIGGNCTTQP
jgi:hypothetical protein